MHKDFDVLMGDLDWPISANDIYIPEIRPILTYPVESVTQRADQLPLQRLLSEKFLFLHGPRNSGKRTLAISIADRFRNLNGVLRLCWVDCLDQLPEEIALGQLKNRNKADEPYLYVFADCDRLIGQFGEVWQSLFASLSSVHVILTVSKYTEELQNEPLFQWADRNRKTVLWTADKELVEQLILASRKCPDGSALRRDLDEYFHTAFEGTKGSANLARVRAFLRSEYKRISEWWTMQQVPPTPADLTDVTLKTELCELLRGELLRVDQVCASASGKKLEEIFVRRVLIDLSSNPEWLEEPEVRLPYEREKQRSWEDLTENLGVAILLADAGYGKTLSLLEEVRRRCHAAQELLALPGYSLDALEFALYLHAGKLADVLACKDISLIHAVISLLSMEHNLNSLSLQAYIRGKLEDGKVLLAIDALDEVADEIVIEAHPCRPREILKDRLLAYLRTHKPRPLLLSARRIGYKSDFLPANEWLLLPFTDPQVSLAAHKWSSGVAGLKQEFEHMQEILPIQQLLQIPTMLMLVALLGEDAIRHGQQLSDFTRRTDLYEKALDLFHRRWVDRVSGKGQMPTRSQEHEFVPFVEELAWRLWQKDIRISQFSPLAISKEMAKVANYGELRKRADLLQDICDSGILTRPEKELLDSPYVFLHRTLLEYLAASYLARSAVEVRTAFDLIGCVQNYFGNPNAYVALWMLAGRLENPGPFLVELSGWVLEQLLETGAPDARFSPSDLAPLLADCIFECRKPNLDSSIRRVVWDVVTNALEETQRRRGRKDTSWTWLADWSLLYRVLLAVEFHETGPNAAYEVRSLLEDLRSSKIHEKPGGVLPEGTVQDVVSRLRAALGSNVPPVRWSGVWAVGAFHQRARKEVSEALESDVQDLLRSDSSPHVRSVAARVLAQIQDLRALEPLTATLNGECQITASGAALGLRALKPVTAEVIGILSSKATVLLVKPALGPRAPLLSALIGSLENLVHEAWEAEREKRINEIDPSVRALLRNAELERIFLRALEYPSPRVIASAASALGKLYCLGAWEPLLALLESPNDGNRDTRTIRASACVALQQLCKAILPTEFPRAISLFVKVLHDSNEHPRVRRPAASALGEIALRGYRPEGLLEALVSNAKQRDESVARSCIFSLLRLEPKASLELLWHFVKGFPSRRLILCQVVGEHPGRTGLLIMDLLLETDNRPEIVFAALSAISHACARASEPRQRLSPPDYVGDSDLLNRLAKRCVALINPVMKPKVLSTILSVCKSLYGLLLRNRQVKLNDQRYRMREIALMFIRHDSEDVRAGAWYLLGVVGNYSDLQTFEKMKSDLPEGKVLRVAQRSMDSLSQRLDRNRSKWTKIRK